MDSPYATSHTKYQIETGNFFHKLVPVVDQVLETIRGKTKSIFSIYNTTRNYPLTYSVKGEGKMVLFSKKKTFSPLWGDSKAE